MSEKTYADFLAEVKKSNPKKKHSECQKIASESYQKYKLSLQPKKAGPVDPDDLKMTVKRTVIGGAGKAADIDGIIKGSKRDINSIKRVLADNGYTDYEIRKAGRDGANTLIFFNFNGLRVPEQGFYKVFWLG